MSFFPDDPGPGPPDMPPGPEPSMGPSAPLPARFQQGPPDGMALPHSLEAEREVLSAVFIDPASMDEIVQVLGPDDFYLERHGLVFEAMQSAYERNGTVDFVTLRQELKDRGSWEKAGGDQTLGGLLDRAGTTSNLKHYCEIVHQKRLIRQMIEAAQSIEVDGYQPISDVEDYLNEAEKKVFAVLEERSDTNLRPVSDVIRSSIQQIEAAYDAEGAITGIGTGFRDLDRMTHGLQRGDLIIVAARPAMGKTSLAINMATNAALDEDHGKCVAIFSLEMPSEQLAVRMMAAAARIDVSVLRGGYLADEDWPRLMNAADQLSKARIFMDDSSALTPSAIHAMCRRLVRKHQLDLVVLDYLQLMVGERGRSREEDISQISRSMKGLAKDLNIPVVCLSQLNRGPEGRTDKRPLMSDLRESGAIEQDADVIMFIYRDEVYNKAVDEDARGIAELIVAKHRNGPTGTVKLLFRNAYTRFDNLATGTYR